MNICMPDSVTMNDARVGITYLWNIACDYVINDWLLAMHIGSMPEEDLLYDESLHNMFAEAIMTLLSKKCGNSKSMPPSEDTERRSVWRSGSQI